MKRNINSLYGILIVIIAGVGAATLVIHVASTNNIVATLGGSEANYAALQQSILNGN